MEPEPAPKPPPWTRPHVQSQIFFLALLALIFFLTWIIFRPFLIYMTMGVFVAVLALPVDRFWERFFPNRPAAFFTMFTIFILVLAPFTLLGFALFQDAQDAVEAVRSGEVERHVENALEVLYPGQTAEERNETKAQVWDDLRPRIEAVLTDLASNAVGYLGNLVIALTIILFVVYYALTDGHRLVAYLRRALPLPAKQVDFLLREAHTGLLGVFVGQILTSVIQGMLGGIGFLIAGLPNPILWAAVMAILSLLPVVGAFLVWVPAVFILLAGGDVWQGIFLAIWGIVVVSQVDNLVRPKLIGGRTNIHPIFVLVGVLGGVAAFGFIGLFLGPLLVGVLISVLKVWEREYMDPVLGAPAETAAPGMQAPPDIPPPAPK